MWACKTKELGNVFLSFFSYLSCIYNSTALYKFYIKTNQSGKLVWMELFNLSFLNSFCCNSLVHLMVDTKQKHWKNNILIWTLFNPWRTCLYVSTFSDCIICLILTPPSWDLPFLIMHLHGNMWHCLEPPLSL